MTVKALEWEGLELYCPCRHRMSLVMRNGDMMMQPCSDEQALKNPVLPGFMFVKCSEKLFEQLLEVQIGGLTPYYDHFHTNSKGRNPYLWVPDAEMDNFQRFCSCGDDDHKLFDQNDVPSYLNGRTVRITSGPFKGVVGTVLRWHGMRRVFVTLGDVATFGTGFIRSCDFELLLS